MSTRAIYGIKIEGVYKLQYNHSDGYPAGLGAEVIRAVRSTPLEVIVKAANTLTVISEKRKPTAAEKKICRDRGLVNLGVSNQSEDDWYCLTRNAQGKVDMMFDGTLPWVSDNFSDDPAKLTDTDLEYAYVVNIDEGTVDFYDISYGVKPRLAKRFSIAEIKSVDKFDVRKYVKAMEKAEEEKA